jgi:fucose 4-O-acetylase-like acetyltransferase
MNSRLTSHGDPAGPELAVPGDRGGSLGMERNRYLDLLRPVAIGAVVYGHWLLIGLTYSRGRFSDLDTLDYVGWGRWLTWAFQVMPVFFLVGGYVNALSWTAHHAQGERWTWWIQRRAMRLWWPTAVYLGVNALLIAVARAAGMAEANIALAGRLITLQMWFLPVYLVLIALTPVMVAAHRRWGLAVPAGMTAAAALVSVGVSVPHLRVLGYANYLLVWGAIHQVGFAWRDGSLTRARWHPYALAAVGAALLAGLVTSGAFPADMADHNTSPPSIALLAYAAAQVGLVLAAEPAATRLLAWPRRWHRVERLNNAVMTVYLWHFVPVLVIAVAFYPAGVMPQPAIGSAWWWELRPA